ncbi:glycosyltransferase [Actinobacillus pleuropneumoniae serovar 11 str. 56153]|uniref:Glycosyltransferase n=3 Tax=Actinobacillus pleuropneumoniae TaxID=715 RepID=A0ABN5MM83_ACTPL|nr:glycosyl transferase [Actinobacillus pleuropneumoniae serovar 1 str. 4074]AXA21918.1 glycosyltransferase [Actinobacillus pleuropneumoniae]EFM93661.1 glycosyltransferase [Actinobacillus pleuropneumoniae serovar 9 str. CVJ13261]EFM97986.1 glycosyltransferase [Actinobacillus pleuropneumoniae serovar 11 str. 56153]MBL4536766.1 glycosyltransferase [Actinobacillus pleuropneumoniae]
MNYMKKEYEELIEKNKLLNYELFNLSKEFKETQDSLSKEIIELKEIKLHSENRVQELERIIFLMENSRSWKMTKYARITGILLRRVHNLLTLLPIAIKKKGGLVNFAKLFYSKLRQGGLKNLQYAIRTFTAHQQSENAFHSSQNVQPEDIDFLFHITKNPNELFEKRILIIAEMSIPQCTKYRVKQKQELFESLGIKSEIVSWTDYIRSKHLISLSSLVIFYRVPAYDSVLSLIGECKRLNIRTFWEVDDLIFDEKVLKESRTINSLDTATVNSLLEGARLYREAMLACGEGVASTPGLAKEMLKAGLKNAYIVENALDLQTLETAKEILSKPSKTNDNKIRIVYGSGTSTHNIDFEEAAPAIAKVLKENSNVIFRIIGMLDLPDYFNGLEKQIERIEFCKYPEYLRYLSECDISIAPLEDYIFNESKSNIKYLEASIVKAASISSPLSAFVSVIESGKNGLIANNSSEWYELFTKLINNVDYRNQLANTAYNFVLERYAPKFIATQLNEFLPTTLEKRKKKRLISFNVFYRPRSFGGATIVAEQINDLIADSNEYEVFVVTTMPPSSFMTAYSVMRYELNNTTIFGICVPNEEMENYENKNIYNIVSDILELVNPDLAHIHCIQGLGVGVVDACTQRNIKTAVTLHDAWWICPRQFMIKADGKFCHQYKIDKNECIKCIGSTSEYLYRSNKLLNSLNKADLLLAPSQYFTDLYQVNLNKKVMVNKNGIKKPIRVLPKFKNKIIRFGYVGGRTNIKGIHLILEAFKKYKFKNAELVVVDNLLNLGQKSYPESDFDGILKYEILPAYTQDNIDEFFNSIDVLLFPTQWKESFGLTVREAIIRNVWVITTDAGGPVEGIIEGVNGNIIPFDSDYKQLAVAIQNVINTYEARDPKEEILLEKMHIATFEEQKNELIQLFKL